MSPAPNPFYGLTPDDPAIFHVLQRGDRDALQTLVVRDRASVNARMKAADSTPLMMAALCGREDLCEILLAAGAPVGTASRFGQTALHLAVHAGNQELVIRLLEIGAAVNAVAAGGDTPLHIAAQFCGSGIVEALIRAGAALEAKRFNESTPAIMAAFGGRTDNIRVLAAHGADLAGARCVTNVGGPWGNCLTIAAEYGHGELLDHLLAAGAWPGEVVNVALKLAAGAGHVGIADALVKKGADPFAPSGANKKSAHYRAKQKKQQAVLELFAKLRPPRPGRAR